MLKEAGNRRGLTTFLGATKKGGGGLIEKLQYTDFPWGLQYC